MILVYLGPTWGFVEQLWTNVVFLQTNNSCCNTVYLYVFLVHLLILNNFVFELYYCMLGGCFCLRAFSMICF